MYILKVLAATVMLKLVEMFTRLLHVDEIRESPDICLEISREIKFVAYKYCSQDCEKWGRTETSKNVLIISSKIHSIFYLNRSSSSKFFSSTLFALWYTVIADRPFIKYKINNKCTSMLYKNIFDLTSFSSFNTNWDSENHLLWNLRYITVLFTSETAKALLDMFICHWDLGNW